MTILFCDLVASTERRARMGDDAFDEFNAAFLAAIRRTLAEHDGREASNAGDGVMAVFAESVADAVSCASALHVAVADLDPITPKLRIGISSGEVAVDGEEFHGMPIVEAARLEAKAEAGQTLASAVVKTLVGSRRSLRFRDVGSLDLKGIPNRFRPSRWSTARWCSTSTARLAPLRRRRTRRRRRVARTAESR